MPVLGAYPLPIRTMPVPVRDASATVVTRDSLHAEYWNCSLGRRATGRRSSISACCSILPTRKKAQDVSSIASVSGGSVVNGYVATASSADRREQNSNAGHAVRSSAGRAGDVVGVVVRHLAVFISRGACHRRRCRIVEFAVALLSCRTRRHRGHRRRDAARRQWRAKFAGLGASAVTLFSTEGEADPVERHGVWADRSCSFRYRTSCGRASLFFGTIRLLIPLRLGKTTLACRFTLRFKPRGVSRRVSAACCATARHQFQDGQNSARLNLLDGGVYDNMAENWPLGSTQRRQRWQQHAASLVEPDEIIAVKAAPNYPGAACGRSILRFLNELFALLRTVDILYDNTTTPRRRSLVAGFQPKQAKEHAGKDQSVSRVRFMCPKNFSTTDPCWIAP